MSVSREGLCDIEICTGGFVIYSAFMVESNKSVKRIMGVRCNFLRLCTSIRRYAKDQDKFFEVKTHCFTGVVDQRGWLSIAH